MIQIAICDDEEYFHKKEKAIISNYMNQRKISFQIDLYSSGKELLEKKEELQKYTMIFLDVSMEELDGIQTASRIRKFSSKVYLVFVTAFITYALEGYKVDAVRFIIKDEACLENAIAECLTAIFNRMEHVSKKRIFAFLEGRKELLLEQILFVESNLHKLTFFLQGNDVKYTMYERLDEIADILEPYHFCRIHKSYLVNLRYVEMIERYQLQLYNGTKLSIAKPRYPEVRNEVMSYRGDI